MFYKKGNLTLWVEETELYQNPREGNNLFHIACWDKHQLGDIKLNAPSEFLQIKNVAIVKDLYVKEEPDGIVLTTKKEEGEWAGFIYCTSKDLKEYLGYDSPFSRRIAEGMLDEELEDYNSYLCGKQFGFKIVSANGDILDNCVGFNHGPKKRMLLEMRMNAKQEHSGLFDGLLSSLLDSEMAG